MEKKKRRKKKKREKKKRKKDAGKNEPVPNVLGFLILFVGLVHCQSSQSLLVPFIRSLLVLIGNVLLHRVRHLLVLEKKVHILLHKLAK